MCDVKQVDRQVVPTFRADAQASEASVGVGAWRCDKKVLEAPWIAAEITPLNAPWAFSCGASFRAIASLELFASLLAVKFLYADDAADAAEIVLAGETDNRGNSFIVQRLACTKFPLVCILMELAWELRLKGRYLEVRWIPRQQNTEADALSNLVTRDFNPELEVKLDLETVSYHCLTELVAYGEEMYLDVSNLKKLRAKREKVNVGADAPPLKKKRPRADRLRKTDPW